MLDALHEDYFALAALLRDILGCLIRLLCISCLPHFFSTWHLVLIYQYALWTELDFSV